MSEGHDENEMEHEHGPFCFSHAEHWRDDSVYAHPEYNKENMPTTADLGKLLSEDLEERDEKVYRFALVFVDEDGAIQLVANPGQTPMSTINLLANAVRILSFQENALEQTAQAIVNQGLGNSLRKAMEGEEEMPDLSGILGGIPAKPLHKVKAKHTKDANKMEEGYL